MEAKCISETKGKTENVDKEKESAEWMLIKSIWKRKNLHSVISATAQICLLKAQIECSTLTEWVSHFSNILWRDLGFGQLRFEEISFDLCGFFF